MILTIGDILKASTLAEVNRLLTTLQWHDGASTAGATARQVKRNEQADLSSRTGAQLRAMVMAELKSNVVVNAFARPAQFSRPLVSRTMPGGGYGLHVDNAFMGDGDERLRTDLSFTLFLSDPSTYEGGHLAIELSGVTHRAKGEIGDLVIYPSSTLHGVEPVTSGERIVFVGWIESLVRNGEQREMLFDLDNLKVELSRSHDANSPEMLVLSRTMANLKRMWMD